MIASQSSPPLDNAIISEMINLVGELKVAVKDHYSDLSMNTEFVGTDSIIAPHYNDLDNPVTEQELCDGLKL